MAGEKLITKLFYQLKPLIPRQVQVWLRHQLAQRKRRQYQAVWPISPTAGDLPAGWPGWPEGKKFAFILMHDVETAVGQQKTPYLMSLEQKLGFRSSFNFVPKRYQVSPQVRQMLTDNGFEVGVHGLTHDGKLYQSRQIFQERASQINAYLADWQAVGFCSPASHHNLPWNHDLHIEYDSSTFDVDPFEPQPDGVETIFPFWVAHPTAPGGYVELPYTLPQDFTVFILLKEKNIAIWQQKLAWIAAQGGMAMLITHPDYMNFGGGSGKFDEYPAAYYEEFLRHVQTTYPDQYWQALPRQIAQFCREISQ